jgi:hypothetical protein
VLLIRRNDWILILKTRPRRRMTQVVSVPTTSLLGGEWVILIFTPINKFPFVCLRLLRAILSQMKALTLTLKILFHCTSFQPVWAVWRQRHKLGPIKIQYDNDNDNDKPIKSLLRGKGLLPPVGLARLDSYGELLPMSCNFSLLSVSVRPVIWFTLLSIILD